MSIRKRSLALPTIAMVAFAGWKAWGAFVPHVTEFSGPIEVAKAESILHLRLPREARNIRVVTYTHWVQYQQYPL